MRLYLNTYYGKVDLIFSQTSLRLGHTYMAIFNKDNKYPQVSQTDDHTAHIYIHQMVMPKTLATWFHIAEHREYASGQKYAIMNEEGAETPVDNSPINKERLSPQGATAPLKQEMQTAQQTIVR